ncbi:TetR/AcrR family transcriptional regulator [Blastococcus sp. URHD0036]|uniref:TetR/AcrR family transcriptional regulator n=1 Tax=Blastococcus sp. URHD0036 TaxID=1380356 RepID=UPI0004954BCE|nr:TetR family transcriptional regulator [Blastococcus sp. URHD0036]
MTETKAAARTSLTRERVVDKALAVADAEGIDAVTIRRLATELGVTPMALYWHFKTKDDLLAGAADRVLDDVVVPPPGELWAEDLRAVLTTLVAAMRPHPQVAPLVATRMMAHPLGLDLTERALSRLAAAGFTPEAASALAMQALRSAIAMVTGDQVDASGVDAETRAEHLRHKQALIASLSPEKYPALVSHAVAMTYCDDEEYFGLGIDLFVAGVRGLAPTPAS